MRTYWYYYECRTTTNNHCSSLKKLTRFIAWRILKLSWWAVLTCIATFVWLEKTWDTWKAILHLFVLLVPPNWTLVACFCGVIFKKKVEKISSMEYLFSKTQKNEMYLFPDPFESVLHHTLDTLCSIRYDSSIALLSTTCTEIDPHH